MDKDVGRPCFFFSLFSHWRDWRAACVETHAVIKCKAKYFYSERPEIYKAAEKKKSHLWPHGCYNLPKCWKRAKHNYWEPEAITFSSDYRPDSCCLRFGGQCWSRSRETTTTVWHSCEEQILWLTGNIANDAARDFAQTNRKEDFGPFNIIPAW